MNLSWHKLTDHDTHRLIHGLFHIALVISTRPWYQSRGTISVEGGWQGQYIKGHVLIYLSHILPGQITCYCPSQRGQITCNCPRKMLLPRSQITCRKLCFYYTCKFGIISIKYVIMNVIGNCYYYYNITDKNNNICLECLDIHYQHLSYQTRCDKRNNVCLDLNKYHYSIYIWQVKRIDYIHVSVFCWKSTFCYDWIPGQSW